MEEEEEEKKKTKNSPLNLDWSKLDKLISHKDNGPPPELVVLSKTMAAQSSSFSHSAKEIVQQMSDHELKESIPRIRKTLYTMSQKLPDKGVKLKENLALHEEELDRRNRLLSEKISDGGETPMQSQSPRSSGLKNGSSLGVAPSQAQEVAPFTRVFCKKLDEKPDSSTPVKRKAFDEELSCLGKGNQQVTRTNNFKGTEVSSRQSPFKCPSILSFDKDKHRPSNGIQKQKHIASSKFYSPQPVKNLATCFSKRRKPSEDQAFPGPRIRKKHTVVLLDDDDCQPIETSQQEDQPLERMKEAKIYYPSRDDPESVELCYSDIDCLAPEAFLSSTIMNFYIRYLQRPVSATGKSRADYHFFNTYFYEKLKEAVSYKRTYKDEVFVKLRRWWKGVNIFQKAYILLPIHENLHWSLVIICIPDKEDDSGPIILHLDSLGYHDRSQILKNIRSYLTEEWNFLNQGSVQGIIPPDIPIADRIWKHLPRRIDDKQITVPQQKNDYDCGIFVLYFMERFIEEAPERLKKKDLAMFGRQWFKPEEASGLRERIRDLLLEEFQNARIDSDSSESSPASSDVNDSSQCNVQPT